MRTYRDIARIAGKRGLSGLAVLETEPGSPLSTDPASCEALVGSVLHFVPPMLDVPRDAALTSISPESPGRFIASFEGIDDVGIVEALAGSHCLIDEEDAEAIGGGFPVDAVEDLAFDDMVALPVGAFEGWRIVDATTGSSLDVVSSETPAGQVLLHAVPSGSDADDAHLIPLADGLVDSVDADTMTICMSLPAGLLDL